MSVEPMSDETWEALKSGRLYHTPMRGGNDLLRQTIVKAVDLDARLDAAEARVRQLELNAIAYRKALKDHPEAMKTLAALIRVDASPSTSPTGPTARSLRSHAAALSALIS